MTMFLFPLPWWERARVRGKVKTRLLRFAPPQVVAMTLVGTAHPTKLICHPELDSGSVFIRRKNKTDAEMNSA
jgi:hypothetical protein